MDQVFRQLLAVLLLVSAACANTLYFKKPSNDLVVCPDNKHTCNTDTTCCPLPNGEYGCCMYANAVCCSDNIHCCPTGSYCDVNTGSCDKGGVKFEWSKKAPAALYIPKEKVEKQSDWMEEMPPPLPVNMEFHHRESESIPWAKKLPGFKVNSLNITSLHSPTSCSVSQTLCKSDSGLSGCCPFPNAVCCDKGQQCCPSGFQCNLKSSKCEKPTEESTRDLTSLLTSHTLFELRDPVVCPNSVTVCPKDTTCCKIGKNAYACCPYPSATCCKDQQHCCPDGYNCDLAGGRCVRKHLHLILVKMTTWSAEAGQVCPDKETTCPEGSTCCPLAGGSFGCCPYPKATCCKDDVHCCPNGYSCDLVQRTCIPDHIESSSLSVQQPVSKMVVCPDGISKCPTTATCCSLIDGSYGCCPYVKAKCCSDGKHCCPDNFICDPVRGRCRIGKTPTTERVSLKTLSIANVSYTYPDSQCPSGSTLCPISSSRFGCCPLPKAVCCHDNKHCCPKNYHCDLQHKRCVMGETSLPLFQKFLPSKSLTVMKPTQKSVKSVMCPDFSECPDKNTCCLMDTGAWGCCPYLNAVCCIDRKHCCPKTYFCDMKQSKCVSSKSSVNPIFSMIYSKIKPAK